MPSSCAREITWAGGSQTFDLGSRRVSWMLRQERHPFPGQFGDTPAACLRRFEEGVQSPDDIERVIEIALLGGGLSQAEVHAIIAEHVHGQPQAPLSLLAHQCLIALFIPLAEEEPA